jgi:ferredoxin
MRITVDKAKCAGHARCAAVAPQVYELDDNGYIAFAEKTVPEQLEKAALRGARACPERIISTERS